MSSGPANQMPAWAGAIMDRTPVAGPAGYYYADVPNRIIAYIIDYIIFIIIGIILGAIALAILGDKTLGVQTASVGSSLVAGILEYGVIAAYFIYTWTAMRGTVGMRLLGMQVGNESDGRTITMNQAYIRFAALWGPGFVATVLASFSPSLGFLGSLVSLVWGLVLLYTTAQSPTKQGLHDKYAHTMVVKAARMAG